VDQRRSIPWGWVLLTFALVVVVGGLAYWYGAHAEPVAHFHPFQRIGFGFGMLGFWLPLLILAVLVGLVVAALTPPARRRETFEDWHRRAHAERTPAQDAAESPRDAAQTSTTTEDGGPPR